MYIPVRRIFIEQSPLGIALYRLKMRMGLPMLPPHILKQRVVKKYADRFSIRTLVETGTYTGDMVAATRRKFNRIVSIELDETLWRKAKEKFARYEHISIIRGDSSEVLPGVVASVPGPCLFWLDAHYSGGITARGDVETPIMKELQVILDRATRGDVVLIDDARDFVGKNDYPTIAQVQDLVTKKRPDMSLVSKDDIIRISSTGNR